MNTKVFKNNIGDTAAIIESGGLVAVPTETVYGLAGNGLDPVAVEKIYEVKGRPAIKPLSLMVPDINSIRKYTDDAPDAAFVLAGKFWPGPLTIIFKAKEFIPSIVLAGEKTVGLRCPDHPLTLSALKESKVPFAAPSANPSGEESPKNAKQVLQYFEKKIDAVIDGGECLIGIESTIVDVTSVPYRVLREGALRYNEIADTLIDEMTIIGISGGTGTGKSTLLNYIGEDGTLLLDCDNIYHQLLEKSEEMLLEIKTVFPDVFVNGFFERKKLGEIVFNNPDKLVELNLITHRYVKSEVQKSLREFAMCGGKSVAIDAVELISSGIANLCDYTIAITADEKMRIERIMKRDNITFEYAKSRIQSQKPDMYYKENCTYCLENNGTPNELIQQFLQIKRNKGD